MQKNQLQIIEKIVVILIAFIFLIGIVFDVLVSNGHAFWLIPKLKEFLMSVLQIQAGVSTLSVAILALITGMSGHEEYGISITRYYMSDRLRILKQLTVIISVISLVFLGVLFELFNLYNLVFATFFCEWVLICFSVISVLPFFGGKGTWKREIRSFLVKNIETLNPDHKMVVQFLSSCKPGQNNYDWKDKQDLLWKVLNSLLKENSAESLEILNSEFCELVRTFLRCNESWEIKRGLTLLQETYENIWRYINNNHKADLGISYAPELYLNLYEDCKIALDHLSMRDVEECFDYERFFENVASVDGYYMKADQTKYENACRYVETLSRYLGYLIKKKTLGAPLSEYSMQYWGKALKRQWFECYNIPEESKEIYQMHRCRVYLGYTISLIIDGHTELFEKNYLETEFFLIRNNKCQLVYRLAVACYLYYLAEVESQHLVSQVTRKCACDILDSKTFKGQFTAMLEQGEWSKNRVFFQDECAIVIEELLKPYEQFKDGQAKRLILGSTVQLFYIFVQCYIANYHFEEIPISEDFATIQNHILEYIGDRELTKKKYRRLYELMIATSPSDNIVNKADALFDNWENRIVERYKDGKIRKAKEDQSTFNNKNIENVFRENTKNYLIKHFYDTFGNIIDQSIEDIHELRFVLLQFTSDTKYFLQEKSLHGIYDYLDGIFVDYVSSYLDHINAVCLYNRSDKDDFEYINDMRSAGIDLLVGSEFELRSKDYKNWKEVNDFHKECECIFVGGTESALAIHKDVLKIAIRDISVSVYESSINTDNDVEYIEEVGAYRIRLLNDMTARFTKEEAEQYIKNQKKVATISVKVTIKTMKPQIGYIVKGTHSK